MASGVWNCSPWSNFQSKANEFMPIKTRVTSCVSTSACAKKLPLYTKLKPIAVPLFSSVEGRFNMINGLCSCEEAPRVLSTEVMPCSNLRTLRWRSLAQEPENCIHS